MKNLAHKGVTHCNEVIKLELARCRIPFTYVPLLSGEVVCTMIGELGPFTFTRAWNYWVVEGPAPLVVAEELYADPVGKDDIRVDGFAGNLLPNSGAEWFTEDGARVFPADKASEVQQDIEVSKAYWPGHYQPDPVFSDDPESISAKLYVTLYHIDSEVGLRIFADTLCAHGLIPEAIPV